MGKAIRDGKAKVKRRPQHSDDALLDAALHMFARDGFRLASMDDVAAAAGSTKPTFYARFGSKREVYEATVRREADTLTVHLFGAYADNESASLDQFVRGAVDAWFDYARDRPDGLRLIFFGDHGGDTAAVIHEATGVITDRIASIVAGRLGSAGRGDAEAALLAAMIIGTVVQAAQRTLVDPDTDAGTASALATSFIVAAMRGIDPKLLGS